MSAGALTTCVVLAGGLGTRLRGAIGELPKCLAPVGERTFLELQIESLARAGVADVVLSLGYRADSVIDAVAAMDLPVRVRCVVEEAPLGTGGAIAHVLERLDIEETMVANGDTFLDADLSAMRQPLDRAGGEWLRMATVAVADRTRYGGVDVDAAGRVTGFVEKGRSEGGIINAGLYCLSRAAFTLGRKGACSLESDVLPELASARRVRAVLLDGSFIDIGIPADYRRFCLEHAG